MNKIAIVIPAYNEDKNIIKLIKRGDRFYTPSKELYRSRSKRIKYNSKGKNFN